VVQVRYIHLGGRPGPGARFLVFLFLVLVLGLIAAIAILALGLFVVVAPVLLAAGFAYYLFRKIVPRPPPSAPSVEAEIIEGEFHVVDPDAPSLSPPSQDRPTNS
jgi:hypothetical protein